MSAPFRRLTKGLARVPTKPERKPSSPGPASQGGIAMERRLAIVLAKLLGSFSVLWIINSNVVALDQPVMMGESSTSSSSAA